MEKQIHRFTRSGVVDAHRLTRPLNWTNGSGDRLRGEIGDWLVTSPEGSRRTVTDGQFRASHEPVSDDLWRRRGEVTAEQVVVKTDVITREGPATAHPGDWVVTSQDGWSWPVRDAVFRASYEPVKAE